MIRYAGIALSVFLALAPRAASEDDKDAIDDRLPVVVAIKFHAAANADCREIDRRFWAKLSTEYAGKDVLFLTADVTSRGSRHQASLLLNTLDLKDVWLAYVKKPGSVVLVDAGTGRTVKSFTAKHDEKAVRTTLDKLLGPDPEMEDEDDDG